MIASALCKGRLCRTQNMYFAVVVEVALSNTMVTVARGSVAFAVGAGLKTFNSRTGIAPVAKRVPHQI